MQPASKDSPLLGKWKDRFGPPRELEISKPIVDEDNFELRRRLLNESSLVSHVLVIRKFGNIGITATQLNLEPGDVVEVLEKYPVGYWRGRHLNLEGIFDADCCVPCRPDGEPLEPIPPFILEGLIEDAETSESRAEADEEQSAAALRKVVLKKISLRGKTPAIVESDTSDDQNDSVSVSIDPQFLDSIGESPRGVMAMLNRQSNPAAKRGSQGRSSPQSQHTSPSTSAHAANAARLAMNSIIKLNIGGQRFATTLPTISKFPDSMLAVMFSGRFAAPVLDEDGYYFIDRDGSHFRYILNFLRDGTVVLPDDTRVRKEILKEAIYFQLPQLVKDILRSGSRTVSEFLTVRYLPGATYDGWPIRIEGALIPEWIIELNGDGSLPPEKETDDGVRNMFGRAPVWKMRGVFLTSIFNVLSQAGWRLGSSNGSGAGVDPKITFAEMYVFIRTVSPKHDTIQTVTQKLGM